MIATLVMGSRYRPLLVWLGAALAFVVHAVVAVAVGQLLELLPHRWIEAVTALLFAGGAAYLLFVPEKDAEAEGEEEADTGRRSASRRWAAAFAGHLRGRVRRPDPDPHRQPGGQVPRPRSVFIGAFGALTTVAALGAFGGRALLRFLPLAVIRKVAACCWPGSPSTPWSPW